MIWNNTLTPNEMHAVNRTAILDHIRRHGPISRSSIAEQLHFSLPTVMRIIDELIEEGLVSVTGEKEYSGGRRRPLLRINADANVIIGIDLGGTTIYGAATDLGGNVLVENQANNSPVSAEQSYSRLVRLISELVHHRSIEGRKILGLAVGTQGLTSHQHGIVLRDPIQNWQNYPLRQKLNLEFNLPVVVDNDVYLAALGELWFGVDQNVRNMCFITIGHGIGAGMIIDGSLYRGSNYLAGEIGYMLPGKEFLGSHRDDFGILESRASMSAITARAQEILKKNNVFPDQDTTPEAIFNAMLNHQPWAQQVIHEMVDYLSIAIANVCAILDPDLIVLRSGLDRYTNLLIDPILRQIEGVVPKKPNIVASKLGYKATALGAIVEVLYDINNFYTIRKLR